MKITRPYVLSLLLSPFMVTAAFLWPVQNSPPGIPPALPPESASALTEPIKSDEAAPSQVSNQLFTTPRSHSALISQPAPAVQNSRGDTKQANRIITKDGRVYPLRIYKTALAPNDPSANQWWVAPNGMDQVWDIPFGTRKTVIAIIDTGFALEHQEFSGRWATNPGETANNGLDDDSNGFIDDVLGWDFASEDANVQAGQSNPDGTDTTHGTMVAGVAAATGNNSVGIAGVNWHSSILPLQALNDDGIGDSFTVASAVYYAADSGVDVISISLGTSESDPYMREAVQYAISKGVVVVASSGNDGCDCILYPAKYPEVIAVGAGTSTGAVASFSSFGSNLDIIAPGQGMATTTWSKTNGSSAYASSVAGTSFSAPFVSGILGLARNYQPNASWPEITGAMFEQSDRRTLTAVSPRNSQIGYGFTRANTMLDRLRTPRSVTMRYSFSPLMADSQGAYQCETGLPATPFYELSTATQLRYTTSPISREAGIAQGLTAQDVGYVCMGLPTDTFSVLRVINLSAEIKNRQLKQ